jgi:uncharacterized protein GlcG (DUF336 family)
MNRAYFFGLSFAAIALLSASSASATEPPCPVSHATLKAKLTEAANADGTGLNNNYWGVVVDRNGSVCAVAYSGANVGDQWLLSRQIASAKAFTALGLSLNGAPFSTGALYAFVQSGAPAKFQAGFPGFAPPNPLFGLNGGNVQDSSRVYQGYVSTWGSPTDPLVSPVRQRVGGTITFGGGLGLYDGTTLVGGLGLSGDTACADHSTAWRTRALLGKAGSGVSRTYDKITLTDDASGHPKCPNDANTCGTTNRTPSASAACPN